MMTTAALVRLYPAKSTGGSPVPGSAGYKCTLTGCALLLLLVGILLSGQVKAHQSNEAYLELSPALNDHATEGVWLVSLLDLDVVLNLDVNQDGQLRWSELTQQAQPIQRYLKTHIKVSHESQNCDLQPQAMMLEVRNGIQYAYLPFSLACQPPFKLRYSAMFSADANHRVLVTHKLHSQHSDMKAIQGGEQKDQEAIETAVITRADPEITIAGQVNFWQAIGIFFMEGVVHILIGYDHILFLLALIIPGIIALMLARVSVAESGQKQKQQLLGLLKMVTAFTVAHSVTLLLAAQHWVSMPSSFIEMVIAVSVVIAGMNLLFNFYSEEFWPLAFTFGLVHGFGFANVLAELSIPQSTFLTGLVAFNLGVEAGQLLILVGVLLLFAVIGKFRFPGHLNHLRNPQPLQTTYHLLQMTAGICIVAVGSLWTLLRGYEWMLLAAA